MARLFGQPQELVPLPAVACTPTSKLPVNLRLLVGQLPATAIGAPGSQQRADFFRDLMYLLDAEGDEQLFPWLLYIRACSNSCQGTRAAYIDLVARPDQAATNAALAVAAAGHLKVAAHCIPVVQMNHAQPLDTVELVVQQPPVVLGFCGFTAAMLEAAGYKDMPVVAEWRGGSRAPGGAPERSKQFTSLVAWVKPPSDDPELRRLPESFQDPTTGGTCRVQVRTRLPNGLQRFLARQALAPVAEAQPPPPPPQQPPASPSANPPDQVMEDTALGQGHDALDGEDMQMDPQPQPQAVARQPEAPSSRRQPSGTRRSKRVQRREPTATEVQEWMATSEVWCSLAEQAQHLLESQDQPWTQRERQALAVAYMMAFERSSAHSPQTEREWLLEHYSITPDEEEYGAGDAQSARRRYPVRHNRGLPADPWYTASTSVASPAQQQPPPQPTGAQGRQGRTR